jgi:hypothetical protein
MDLSNFKTSPSMVNKGKANSKGSNPMKRGYIKVKDWIYPSLTTTRQQRLAQYKNLTIFAGGIILVAYFEDKIKNIL